MNPEVDKIIDRYKAQMIRTLQENIRIPSVKSEPKPSSPFGTDIRNALDHMLNIAENLGFSVQDLDGYIGLVDHGEGSETLGIMCHLDVVPEGSGWKYPPYGAIIADGKIYGRGTTDDKGPAVSALYALAAVRDAGIPFKRKVRIMLGCDEESGWSCMDYYNKKMPMPELAFSPDAAYPLVNSEKGILQATYKKAFASNIKISAGTRANVVPGEACAIVKDIAFDIVSGKAAEFKLKSGFECTAAETENGIEIKTVGLGAHAATPQKGKNALQALILLLNELPLQTEDLAVISELARLFAMEIHGESVGIDVTDASGRLTLNVGIMQWDETGISKLSIDIRHPICLEGAYVLAKLSKALLNIGLELSAKRIQSPHYVSPDSELVKKLLEVYAKRSGENLPPLAIGGGTYARCIENAVAFGCHRPGRESLEHMPDEYISIEDQLYNTYMIADAIIALAAVE